MTRTMGVGNPFANEAGSGAEPRTVLRPRRVRSHKASLLAQLRCTNRRPSAGKSRPLNVDFAFAGVAFLSHFFPFLIWLRDYFSLLIVHRARFSGLIMHRTRFSFHLGRYPRESRFCT